MSIDFISLTFGALLGVGAAVAFVLLRMVPSLRLREEEFARMSERSARLLETEERLAVASGEAADLRTLVTRLETQAEERERRFAEQAASLETMREELGKAFAELSQDALRRNNAMFLDLAQENLSKFQEQAKGELDQRKQAFDNLVTPIKESLEKVDRQIVELNEKQATSGATLMEQLKQLTESERKLQTETASLVRALRNPGQRGRWGEVQLRRVAELAGMVEYCDFNEQQTQRGEEGALRPDMIVRLPAGKTIVVDSKTPLDAYLSAIEAADDATRADFLKAHARQVREQIKQLGSKRYWDQFEFTPDFVVAFLPGEPMYGAALEHDPTLIEFGVDHKVLIVTPVSLIALLRVVAQGWRHERLEENAQRISNLGKDLYARVTKLAEHFSKVGKNLDRAVASYNEAAGTLETRVLVQARKFKELQASTADDIESVEPIERTARALQSSELKPRPAPLVETLFRNESLS